MPLVRFLNPKSTPQLEDLAQATVPGVWDLLLADRETLSQELSTFTHDARARIGAAQGYVELLREDLPNLTEDQARYLRNVLEACRQLQGLLEAHRATLLGPDAPQDEESV